MTALVIAIAVVAWALVVHTVVNALLLRRPPAFADVRERVSVLVPARDEAKRIGPCLRALATQIGLPDLELIVLDDCSTDGTGEVARAVLADAVAAGRAAVLAGAATPPGWIGKAHACAQLAQRATGDVLVFVDADVVCAPDGVARAVAQLRNVGLALASPYPRQLADSWLERLVQPLLQWSILTFLPVRAAERSARPSVAAANGQLIVVDAAAYRRSSGHEAVRTHVVEDVALARAVQAAGGRVAVTDGTALAQCRMYDGARALVDGYAKWMWVAFGSPVAGLAVALAMLGLYALPWGLVAVTPWAWVAVAAGPAGRVVSAARTGGRAAPDPLLHVLSVLAFAAIVTVSVDRRRRRSITWKRRVLP